MVTNPSYPSPESLPQGKGDPKSHPGAMTDRIPMSFSPGMPTRAEGTPKSYQRALPIHSWITASRSPWPRGGTTRRLPPRKATTLLATPSTSPRTPRQRRGPEDEEPPEQPGQQRGGVPEARWSSARGSRPPS